MAVLLFKEMIQWPLYMTFCLFPTIYLNPSCCMYAAVCICCLGKWYCRLYNLMTSLFPTMTLCDLLYVWGNGTVGFRICLYLMTLFPTMILCESGCVWLLFGEIEHGFVLWPSLIPRIPLTLK